MVPEHQFVPYQTIPYHQVWNWKKHFFFSDVKVAVGQANGRISLLSFYAGGAAIKEFGPKSGRACNDLAWNPKFTNYLAAAYGKNSLKIKINCQINNIYFFTDKSRNDHSILIFDTALAPPSQTEASSSAVAKIVSKTSTSKVRFLSKNCSKHCFYFERILPIFLSVGLSSFHVDIQPNTYY